MSKKLAIVKDGAVVNTIIGEAGFDGGIECGDTVGPGWTYNDGVFSPPEIEEEVDSEAVDNYLASQLSQFTFDGHVFPLNDHSITSFIALGYLALSSPESIAGVVLYDREGVSYQPTTDKIAVGLADAAASTWLGQKAVASSIKHATGSVEANFRADSRWLGVATRKPDKAT